MQYNFKASQFKTLQQSKFSQEIQSFLTVCSHKVKKKLFDFLFQEEGTRKENQIKTKPKSNSVHSVPTIWDSCMIFWAPKGLSSTTSPVQSCVTHTHLLTLVQAISTQHLPLSLEDVLWSWHLQNPGASPATAAAPLTAL